MKHLLVLKCKNHIFYSTVINPMLYKHLDCLIIRIIRALWVLSVCICSWCYYRCRFKVFFLKKSYMVVNKLTVKHRKLLKQINVHVTNMLLTWYCISLILVNSFVESPFWSAVAFGCLCQQMSQQGEKLCIYWVLTWGGSSKASRESLKWREWVRRISV